MECDKVVKELDFQATIHNVHTIEEMLSKVSPAQLCNLIKTKDPNGEHGEAAWFKPWVDRGYVKGSSVGAVTFDDDFWRAYEAVDMFCDQFRTFHFPCIELMKSDVDRLIEVAGNAKVKSVPYVFAIINKTNEEIREVEERLEKVSNFAVGREGHVQLRRKI